MPKLRKRAKIEEKDSVQDIKMSENKTTINDLNDDCIQLIIKKLSIKEIFRIERVDKRFRYLAQEVLKQKKVLSFGYSYCKHSTINSQITGSEFDIKSDKMKTIFKKCPNIKCLQIRDVLINKLLFKWISKNCKQLVCIHISGPKNFLKTPKIAFKGIANLLNDKIEIEINLGYDKNMREDSVIALIQNMSQIKEIDFYNDFH